MRVVRPFAVAVLVLSSFEPSPARADLHAGRCQVVDVDLQPSKRNDLPNGINPPPQIVVWVEDSAGNYIDTVFITKQTGTHGLGNRPGRSDFNSGPLWPYGRRTAVFPVWAHKKLPLEFDEVAFQNGDENNLSHPFDESSRDANFCRPMQPSEPAWDALSCASPNAVFTDKGVLMPARKSKYPPRQDITRAAGLDSPSVDEYAAINPFDGVSQATPQPDTLATLSWAIPATIGTGSYVMWVEISKEFDHNETYSVAARPAPVGIPWGEYGEAYRGQPSVVYKVPFTIGVTETIAVARDFAGYGDPDGLDGNLRAPDETISTTVPGSGALRIALVPDGNGEMFRVRVTSRPEFDYVLPGSPAEMTVDASTRNSATVTFIAPGDDGTVGKVRGYEVRYRIREDITDDNFDDSIDPKLSIPVGAPGSVQELTLDRLLPETEYTVAIRAFDDCRNTSKLTVVKFSTPARAVGEVDACFVATAAYGSVLAADVEMLRHMRDAVLRKTVLGEIAVQAYYTFGPAMAGVIGESELLRATARELLAPVIRYARGMSF